MKLKKMLAAVLTMAMVATALPVTAFADDVIDTEAELKTALEAGGEVELGGDIEVTKMIAIPAGVTATLDLNGYDITSGLQTDTTKHIYPLDVYGTLTIQDSGEDGSISGRGIYNQDGAKLTVNGAKIVAEDWNGGAGIWSYGSGEVYLNDATIIGNTGVVSSEGYLEINGGTYTCYSGINDEGAQVATPTYNIRAYNGLKITDGTFTSRHGVISVGGGDALIEDGSFKIEFKAATTSNVVYLYGDADMTIKGGDFISDDSANKADSGAAVLVSGSSAKLTIKDGKFLGMNGMVSINENTVIEGGSFDTVWNYNHYGSIESAVAEGATVTVANKTYVKSESGLVENPVAKIKNKYYTSLQAAIDAAANGDTVTLLADVTEDVKITQKADLDLVIDGKGKTFTGVMTVFGDARYNGDETLTIQNVVFQAAEDKDSCILSPDRTAQSPARYSYSHNVTVDNCTFKGNEVTPYEAAAVRHGDGGDVNWTITNCTVDANMHSMLQVNNVGGETGLVIDNCEVYSKNGLNLNACTNVEITNNTIDVTGYAVRAGVSSGGNLGEAKSIVLENNVLTSDCDDGDAVIMLRASAVNAKIDMEENAVSGATHISGTTEATKVSADANYWADATGNVKTAPVVADSGTPIPVISYYEDAALKNLVEVTTVENFPEGMTVTDGKGNFYATMKDALEGIHLTGADTLICKADANVGAMTHGHVCRDLTVYGNGAYVSGGEQEFELDTFNCDGQSGSNLTGETTLKVIGLNGAGAWGQRTTENTINLIFEDCKDMSRIYFSGTAGETNIILTKCTFTSNTGGSCKVYSNTNGEIVINDCDFSSVDIPVNLNHKEAGEQKVTIKDSTFTNCGTAEYDYAAPVRVLSSVEGAKTTLTIENCSFAETKVNKVGQNADILLDYGVGDTTAVITDTNANLVIETKTVTESEETVPGEVKEVTVTDDETVTASNGGEVEETPESVPTTTPSTGKGGGSTKYKATVDKDSIENGTVKLSSTRAKKGATVTITVTPDEGYELDELKVLDDDGEKVELTDKGDGKYAFKMPKGGVEIEASFEEIDEEPTVDKPADDEEVLVLTINQLIYQLNGSYEANDVAPIIKGDRTMLPIRLIAEFLGATVTWSEADQSVTIVKDDTTIVIYIGQAFALVNGEPVQLDEAAFIQNDRTYLPLRFVAENLGATVTWDGVNQTVTIVPGK